MLGAHGSGGSKPLWQLHITDGHGRKMQLLAMGGLELQSAYYGIPGCAEDDADPLTDPYVSIKEKLTQYFSPKHHDTFERFLFWSMVPDDHEPIEKFAQRVQQKAEKCSFGKSEIESRQIAIMDKIIQYATDDLRQKLLEKEQLALDEALKTINAYQSVRYQASKMNTKQGSAFHQHEMVNRLYQNSKKPLIPDSKPRCLRCGYIRHREAEQCPALGKTCLRCNKPGHFQSVCKTKSYTVNSGNFDRKRKAVISNNQGPSRPAKFRPVFNIDEQREETKREDHAVYNVGGSDEVITCNVGGVDIKMLIDSGSKHNLIDDTTWQLMKLRDVKSFNERFDHEKRFLAYGRVPLKLVTVFDADLEIEDGDRRLKTTATFYVIGKGQQPLLGKTTAQKIGVLKTAFLGHILTSEGIAPAEEKVKSILQFRSPQTKEELRSFLGLVTYVSRFIPNLATVNHPLRELLKQESSFDWKSVHQEAFDQLKKMIGSVDNLGYYDPNDRTLLITDASGVGLGAV
ncbi:uncharacterized protein LOC134222253 [Armigeres subalbatus]|uniref:uncharacterized protein LOC134222253 n=1 Tax=Armigeres subalbatus TaxID=124917 RepID=UPI002ED63765